MDPLTTLFAMVMMIAVPDDTGLGAPAIPVLAPPPNLSPAEALAILGAWSLWVLVVIFGMVFLGVVIRALKPRAKAACKAADAGMVKALGAGLRSARAYAKRIEDEAGKQC